MAPKTPNRSDEELIEIGLRALIRSTGADATDFGFRDTPSRVRRAFAEVTCGYAEDPREILSRVFPQRYDEMVVVKGVRFFSTCEHHLLPFEGTAAVGYIPRGKVVGLSKLARLVNCFAHRLQIQERMTSQIAEAMMLHLRPVGAGVVVEARHLCMACRGVRQTESSMVTSSLLGAMRRPGVKAEFLALAGYGR